MKILLVDDDQKIRSLTRAVLTQKLKADIFEAENGSEGLSLLQKIKFDIIILDNEMPVMNGYEFLGRVRSNKSTKYTPVIVLTASNDSQTVSRYLNLDVSDYVLKPFKQDELITKIKKNVVLNKKILMIDDNTAFTGFIQKIISTKFPAIDFISAENGSGGLAKIVDERPDLILLDINMPEINGIELVKKMREEYSGINIPVIMLTSVNDKETIQLLAENDVTDYILKPVNINDFAKKIEKAFE